MQNVKNIPKIKRYVWLLLVVVFACVVVVVFLFVLINSSCWFYCELSLIITIMGRTGNSNDNNGNVSNNSNPPTSSVTVCLVFDNVSAM